MDIYCTLWILILLIWPNCLPFGIVSWLLLCFNMDKNHKHLKFYIIIQKLFFCQENCGWASVAHSCNPSNSGGRDQEDHGLRSAWGNSLQDPISKMHNIKRLTEWFKWKSACLASVRPWIQTQYHQKEKIVKKTEMFKFP
jgi:hypothetical protein